MIYPGLQVRHVDGVAQGFQWLFAAEHRYRRGLQDDGLPFVWCKDTPVSQHGKIVLVIYNYLF